MTDPLLVKPGTNAQYTIDDMIREAKRELTMRHKVYWGQVERGVKTREEANRLIHLQQAIVDTLVRVKAWHWPDRQGGLNV